LFSKAIKPPDNKLPDNKVLGGEPPDDNELSKELEKLRSVLNYDAPGSSESNEERRYPGNIGDLNSNEFIDIFIAFDEARTLSEAKNSANESYFVVLRRVLSSISSCPLYTFFLFTTRSITSTAVSNQTRT
jgi:hypothetical protein